MIQAPKPFQSPSSLRSVGNSRRVFALSNSIARGRNMLAPSPGSPKLSTPRTVLHRKIVCPLRFQSAHTPRTLPPPCPHQRLCRARLRRALNLALMQQSITSNTSGTSILGVVRLYASSAGLGTRTTRISFSASPRRRLWTARNRRQIGIS
jgi:hypothetical protein